MISDDDFLKLFNTAALAAKTAISPPVAATNLDQTLPELNIDSLDAMIMGMYLCETFGVPEEKGKHFQPKTVGEYKDLLVNHATKKTINVEEAIENIKWASF